MKKKSSNISFIYEYTPDVLEMEKIIKKFPVNEQMPELIELAKSIKVDGETRIDKTYQFRNCKGKVSPVYRLALNFDRGYALVMNGCQYYYIDPDFNTVICEEKIKNCDELYQIMKSNRESVLKYVSTQKIEELRDPVATDFLLGRGDKKQAGRAATMLHEIDLILTQKPEYTA